MWRNHCQELSITFGKFRPGTYPFLGAAAARSRQSTAHLGLPKEGGFCSRSVLLCALVANDAAGTLAKLNDSIHIHFVPRLSISIGPMDD
jgi:hypothetical protein